MAYLDDIESTGSGAETAPADAAALATVEALCVAHGPAVFVA